jgi:glycosyltransferase involved in cell wall biosynthesis
MIDVPQDDEPGELRAAMDAAVRELANLERLAPRSREALGDLLDRAVAVVNTSEREGLPNVFLEGWARGVPALALSYDPAGLITGHGLGYVAGGDGAELAARARQLWRERGNESSFAARCIAYVRSEHDREAVVDRWMEALDLSSAGHPS